MQNETEFHKIDVLAETLLKDIMMGSSARSAAKSAAAAVASGSKGSHIASLASCGNRGQNWNTERDLHRFVARWPGGLNVKVRAVHLEVVDHKAHALVQHSIFG